MNSIDTILLSKKKLVLQKWFDLLVNTYPIETVRMLKKESNQFANPVGHTFSHALGEIFDEFFQENDLEKMTALLDRIIRIRAVQDFAPSGALAFIFSLKQIAREFLQAEITEGQVNNEDLSEFDERVDGLALLAFDVYARCRENLFEVRIGEIKSRTHRLLQRAELIAEVPPEKPEAE